MQVKLCTATIKINKFYNHDVTAEGPSTYQQPITNNEVFCFEKYNKNNKGLDEYRTYPVDNPNKNLSFHSISLSITLKDKNLDLNSLIHKKHCQIKQVDLLKLRRKYKHIFEQKVILKYFTYESFLSASHRSSWQPRMPSPCAQLQQEHLLKPCSVKYQAAVGNRGRHVQLQY